MSKGIIGKKIGMTRLFIQDGNSVPVTVIETKPATVVQVKTLEKDGYEAVQLGYGSKKHPNKPETGHAKKIGAEAFEILKEFSFASSETPVEPGTQVSMELFAPGDLVSITGTTKGKGFAGVMKRHGFGGGRASHGCVTHRSPGSIGCSAYPGRVFKGRKMAGHAGARTHTVKNLKIVDIRPEYGVILIRGAVPGPNGGILFLNKN